MGLIHLQRHHDRVRGLSHSPSSSTVLKKRSWSRPASKRQKFVRPKAPATYENTLKSELYDLADVMIFHRTQCYCTSLCCSFMLKLLLPSTQLPESQGVEAVVRVPLLVPNLRSDISRLEASGRRGCTATWRRRGRRDRASQDPSERLGAGHPNEQKPSVAPP